MSDFDARLLAERAQEARRWAYAPYSHYAVGAALLAASGRVYDGCNVENAAYPSTICAERVAAVKAVSEGERDFVAIAVATANGGMPCGSCRQFLAEFGVDLAVLIVDGQGAIVKRTTLADLLPDSFGPAHLPRP
ncbi:MAG: cytidine deaminase [Anaerolineales bacterium]|nr:cytidine deaminase [Anaerolineales bacterium]